MPRVLSKTVRAMPLATWSISTMSSRPSTWSPSRGRARSSRLYLSTTVMVSVSGASGGRTPAAGDHRSRRPRHAPAGPRSPSSTRRILGVRQPAGGTASGGVSGSWLSSPLPQRTRPRRWRSGARVPGAHGGQAGQPRGRDGVDLAQGPVGLEEVDLDRASARRACGSPSQTDPGARQRGCPRSRC